MAVKPIKPQPMGKATIVGDRTGTCSGWCNVASAIRLVSDEEAQQSKLLTMCDMGLCPVVHAMSYSGVVHETVTHVVVITARQTINNGTELVCSIDPKIYSAAKNSAPAAVRTRAAPIASKGTDTLA